MVVVVVVRSPSFCLAVVALLVVACKGLSSIHKSDNGLKFVILGGTGRIGTATAIHLLLRAPPQSRVVLVGRDEQKGKRAVEEVLSEQKGTAVSWERVDDCWDENNNALCELVEDADCLVHTAGPYLNRNPTPLKLAIRCRCQTYIDVSDPLDYLNASLDLAEEAKAAGVTALLAAGAFPGMSNVLAVEAASHLETAVRNVRFHYFTAGLGGSGDINLYITNLGFGEAMAQFESGKLRMFRALSGQLLGKVDFFLEKDAGFGNNLVRERVGTKTVFSWPFPEAATVPGELKASGDSSAAMGTAPDIWNTMLGILVSLVPTAWWRSEAFSGFLADFSQPLVKLTDAFLAGETHAMRVDVSGADGGAVSVVQAHDSFRRCVGQSCAEFALDLLAHPSPGVELPEQRYRDRQARARIVSRLTQTPGTFAFTGAQRTNKMAVPTDLDRALKDANEKEQPTSTS